jgi:hypothetical protein
VSNPDFGSLGGNPSVGDCHGGVHTCIGGDRVDEPVEAMIPMVRREAKPVGCGSHYEARSNFMSIERSERAGLANADRPFGPLAQVRAVPGGGSGLGL